MLKYVKKYTLLALLAAAFMVGEVSMDLIQPTLMSRIVDEGVLGTGSGGAGNMEIILRLGLQMIALVIFGGLCGSMNNVFTQTASQGIGNDIRKDCFRRIMAFSFPQLDRFGTGSLVTRVTNDITQVQTFLSLFVRGMIRTGMLTFGSIAFMLRLNPAFGRIVIAAFPLIVAVLAFCLVPFLKLGIQYLLYKLAAVLASVLTDSPVAKLVGEIGGAFGLMLGMVGASALVTLISVIMTIAMAVS